MASDEDTIESILTDATLGRPREVGAGLKTVALLANMDADVLANCLRGDRVSAAGLVALMIGGAVVSAFLVYITLNSLGTGDQGPSTIAKLGISIGVGTLIFLFDRWVVGGAAAQLTDRDFEQSVDRHFLSATRRGGDQSTPGIATVPKDESDPVAVLREKLGQTRPAFAGGVPNDDAKPLAPLSIFDEMWIGTKTAFEKFWLVGLRFAIALALSSLFAIGAELTLFSGAIEGQLRDDESHFNAKGMGREESALMAVNSARRLEIHTLRTNLKEKRDALTTDINRLNVSLKIATDSITQAQVELQSERTALGAAVQQLRALTRHIPDAASTQEAIVLQDRVDRLRAAVVGTNRMLADRQASATEIEGRIRADNSEIDNIQAKDLAALNDATVASAQSAAIPGEVRRNLVERGDYRSTILTDFLERYIALQELQDDPRRGPALKRIDWLLLLVLVLLEMLPLLAIMIFRMKSAYPELLVSALRQRVRLQTYLDEIALVKASEDVAYWNSVLAKRRGNPPPGTREAGSET